MIRTAFGRQESPTVSVMMPCFNAAATLPGAIASLLAQTHEDWECLLIDDGSTDRTQEILDNLTDPRFRITRLPENQGRGVARQIALDQATGDYLAFLDADDWLYPDKLARQVDIMEGERDLVAVSSKVCAVSPEGDYLGSAWGLAEPCEELTCHQFRGLGRPRLNYVTSMIRMDAAKSHAYNPALRRSQDLDFMIKVLQGLTYAVQPDTGYVYSGSTPDLPRSREAIRYERMIYKAYLTQYPWSASRQIAKTWVRSFLMELAFPLGLIEKRANAELRRCIDSDLQEFETARMTVNEIRLTLDRGVEAPNVSRVL